MLRLVKRKKASAFWLFMAPNVAVALTLLAGMLMFGLLGFDIGTVFHSYFISPIQDMYGITEVALKASPLILIALGLAFSFKANIWNIGAEGQYLMGAVAGSAVALIFHTVDAFWVLPLMVLFGVIGGVLWAMIPAVLKVYFNVSEILSSLMLNYVALQLLLYMTHGPMKDPDGINFPESKIFSDSAMLKTLVEDTRLNTGFIVVVLLIPLFWLVISHGMFGFWVTVKGFSERASVYAGFSGKKVIFYTFALSGGMAGLAGIFEIAGPVGQLTSSFSTNYGYTAIIVVFLGRLHPVGIFMAGITIALTFIGGENAQIDIGLPLAATGVFQSMLLFFLLACDVLRIYQLKITRGNHE